MKEIVSEQWPIEKLKLWDKNPRGIDRERFQKLKERMKNEGQVKPVIVTREGIVAGGNMRLRAMRELGWKNIWVSVRDAKTDKEIFDLALLDNEQYGFYEKQGLAELAVNLGLTPLELDSYEINLGKPTSLLDLTKQFGPDDDEETAEDEPEDVPVLVVVATCTDQEQQQELADELDKRGFTARLAQTQVDGKSLAKLFSGDK